MSSLRKGSATASCTSRKSGRMQVWPPREKGRTSFATHRAWGEVPEDALRPPLMKVPQT